jgi:hypothetical protein
MTTALLDDTAWLSDREKLLVGRAIHHKQQSGITPAQIDGLRRRSPAARRRQSRQFSW